MDVEKENGEEKAEEEADLLDVEETDVFGIADVCNIGDGEPLFANFTFEDWALLSLRYEMHLLVHAFRRDVDDPERLGIHQEHVSFYYNKYFRKAFNTKYYGVDTYDELVDFIRDTVDINSSNLVLEAQLSDELDNFDLFLKLTEENRRERQLRIDSGDETAVLKFSRPTPAVTSSVPAANAGAIAALPQKSLAPYQRGPRPPVPARGFGGPPQGQKPWYGNAPQGQKGSYYTPPATTGGNFQQPPPAGGKGYQQGPPQQYAGKGGNFYGKGKFGK